MVHVAESSPCYYVTGTTQNSGILGSFYYTNTHHTPPSPLIFSFLGFSLLFPVFHFLSLSLSLVHSGEGNHLSRQFLAGIEVLTNLSRFTPSHSYESRIVSSISQVSSFYVFSFMEFNYFCDDLRTAISWRLYRFLIPRQFGQLVCSNLGF